MPLSLRISLSLLLLALPSVRAQLAPADDFFHRGAQSYITNNLAKAREAVDQGLQIYPKDTKLKKLDELLKQQQQSQNNQQDQQGQQDQEQQSKDSQQRQDKKDQQQQEQQKQQQEQPKQQDKDTGDKPKEQKGNQQQARPAQMTPQQAERLLDSQKGSEQVLWFKPEGKPENPDRPTKDW